MERETGIIVGEKDEYTEKPYLSTVDYSHDGKNQSWPDTGTETESNKS